MDTHHFYFMIQMIVDMFKAAPSVELLSIGARYVVEQSTPAT